MTSSHATKLLIREFLQPIKSSCLSVTQLALKKGKILNSVSYIRQDHTQKILTERLIVFLSILFLFAFSRTHQKDLADYESRKKGKHD